MNPALKNDVLLRRAYRMMCVASVPLQRVSGHDPIKLAAAQDAHALLGVALDIIGRHFCGKRAVAPRPRR